MSDTGCGCTGTAQRPAVPKVLNPDRHVYARTRGACQHNGCVIEKGERIVKVDVGIRGPQTAGRNGQGEWWCLDCALADATE